MESESTSSIDMSVAFFASILVLFVFVSFVVVKRSAEEKPVIGQEIATTTVVPASWDPYPRRTRYALAYGGRLQLLDLRRSANALAGNEKKILVAGQHFDSSRIISGQADPGSVRFQFETTGKDMPQGTIEQSVEFADFPAGNKANHGEPACPLIFPASKGAAKPTVSVYINSGDEASLDGFLRIAATCKFAYRILLLKKKRRPNDPMVLNFARSKEFFTSEKLFR